MDVENYQAALVCGRAAAWDKPRSGEKRRKTAAVQDAGAIANDHRTARSSLGLRQPSGALKNRACRRGGRSYSSSSHENAFGQGENQRTYAD